jgi:hypothetical protein
LWEKHEMAVPIYSGNKVIGEVRGRTFHKRVHSSRHFLTRPPAIAFDVGSLRQAENAGASQVDVFDEDTGKHWRAALTVIWEHGREFDRGHGRQIYLPLDLWNQQPPARQASLFDWLGGAAT